MSAPHTSEAMPRKPVQAPTPPVAAPRFLPYLAVFNTAFAWSLSPVFMRYMSASYDPFTQIFVRYFSGLILLVPMCLYFFPVEFKTLLRRPQRVMGLALLGIAQITMWTNSMYLTTATTAMLVSKLQVPVTILLSFLLFREERKVIRSFPFLFGAFLGLAGVMMIVLAKSEASAKPTHNAAIILLLLVAFSWGLYNVWGKHLVSNAHPVPLFTTISIFVTSGTFVIMLIFGNPSSFIEAGPRIALLAFFSGIYPIATGHITFLYAQKHLGSAFSATITLLSPLMTHLVAWHFWPDEKLVALQWLGAGALLFGSFLVVQAQRRRGMARAAKAVPAPPE